MAIVSSSELTGAANSVKVAGYCSSRALSLIRFIPPGDRSSRACLPKMRPKSRSTRSGCSSPELALVLQASVLCTILSLHRLQYKCGKVRARRSHSLGCGITDRDVCCAYAMLAGLRPIGGGPYLEQLLFICCAHDFMTVFGDLVYIHLINIQFFKPFCKLPCCSISL